MSYPIRAAHEASRVAKVFVSTDGESIARVARDENCEVIARAQEHLMPDKPAAFLGLKAIAFDFDGVILESAGIKSDAFLELFADYPEHHEAILEHHYENLGVSRFKKFEWISRELLGEPLTDEAAQRLGKAYSGLVLDKVLECPPVPGALELLQEIDGHLLTFVVSATPQEELELIVRRRGLDRHFREVRGTPPPKDENLSDLLRCYSLAPQEMLMVGDGLSDHRASRRAGIQFVLRETPDQADLCRHVECPRVLDLAELGRLLAPSVA